MNFVIDTLAAYRLTRFVQYDSFPPMVAVRKRINDTGPDYLVEMVDCPWCIGLWISIAISLSRRYLPGWSWMSNALATSSVVGLVSGRI